MGTVKPIPAGYHSITPYLYVKGAAKALDFYGKAFGATERMRMDMPDGTIGHAEIQIGDSVLMLADPPPRPAPRRRGSRRHGLARALRRGRRYRVQARDRCRRERVEPLQDKFYGDRMGTLRDPFGFEWSLGTHIEDVSEAEMQRRMAQMGS
jgi:PhnB protein